MNPMSIITLATSAITLATQFAPLVPQVVTDVEGFVAKGTQAVADIKKLDASAALSDVEAIFQQIQLDIPTVTQVIAASKSLAAAV